GGGTITVAASFTNQADGTVEATGTGTTLVQTPVNFSAGTLTGGMWGAIGGGTLRVINSGIVHNAAAIVLDGASSHFYRDSGTTSAVTGLASNDAGGSFTIKNGFNFTTAAAFPNGGTLVVGTSSTFKATGNYTQTGGDTDLQGGTLN